MTPYAIDVECLWRSYGDKAALCGVTLAIPRGRIVALLGPNGAGKSTLLRLIVGLLDPDKGMARVLGAPARSLPDEVVRRVSCQLEGIEPLPRARLDTLIGLEAEACPRFDRPFAQCFCLDQVSRRKRYGELSKGQARRFLAGLTLASGADVMIFDEPTAGLDTGARRTFFDALRDRVTATEATAIVATHILYDIERVADDVALLHHGTLRLHASLEDLRDEVREVTLPPESDWRPDAGCGSLCERISPDARTLWVRLRDASPPADALSVRPVNLEELYLALTQRAKREPVPCA